MNFARSDFVDISTNNLLYFIDFYSLDDIEFFSLVELFMQILYYMR